MKRIVVLVLLCMAVSVVNSDARMLRRDGFNNLIDSAVRNKAYQQVPFALSAATKVIRFSGTLLAGELDLRDALGVIIRPSSNNLTAWFDSDTTKTWTIDGGQELIMVVDDRVSTLTISGTDAVIEVGGF